MRYSRCVRFFVLAIAVMTSRCQCAEDLSSTVPDLPQADVCVTPSPGADEICYSDLKAECEDPNCVPVLSAQTADFGPSGSETLEVVVKSVGEVALEVYSAQKHNGVDEAGAFVEQQPADPDTLIATLEPGESHTFLVDVTSGVCGTHGARYSFFTNDAEYPNETAFAGDRETPDDPIQVDLFGTMTATPQIDLCVIPSPGADELCYEDVKAANQAELCAGGGDCLLPTLMVELGDLMSTDGGSVDVVLKSTGGAPVELYAPEEDFGVDISNRFRIEGSYLPGELVATLAPGEEHSFTVNVTGGMCGLFNARFLFRSTDSHCVEGDPGDDFDPGQPDDPISVGFSTNLVGACMCPPGESTLLFGSVNLGNSKTMRYSYQSCGDFPLEVTTASITDDAGGVFVVEAYDPPPPFTLQPGEAAHIDVRYTPAFLSPTGAPDAGRMIIESNNAGGVQSTVYLVGYATELPVCDIRAVPAVTDFGIVTSSSTRQVRVINEGEIVCNLYELIQTAGSSDFAISGGATIPTSIQPGNSEFVNITFTPTIAGDQTAEFSATADDTNAGVSNALISVFGTNEIPEDTNCFLQVDPDFVDFGDVSVGDAVLKTIKIKNLAEGIGFPPCNITSAELTSGAPDFHGGDTGMMSSFFIPPGMETSASIWFEPLTEGQKTGTLALRSPGGDHDIPLYGNSQQGRLCIDVDAGGPIAPVECDATQPCATAAFGDVVPPATLTRDITLSSCGEGVLHVRGLTLDPAGSATFELLSPLPADLPVRLSTAETVNLQVRYTPINTNGDFSGIDIISTAPVDVARVALTGNDDGTCHRVLRCNPEDLNFGTQDVGVTEVRTAICTNFGSEALSISDVTLTGNPDCTIVSNSSAVVDPGQSFSVQIACNPSAAGIASANGAIISDACDASPFNFTVEVNGYIPVVPPCIGSTTFSPLEKWRWTGTPDYPTYDDVWTTPAVAQLTDDNLDGVIDVLDTPDIIFTALRSNLGPTGNLTEEEFCKANNPAPAVMVAVSGDNGDELWTFGRLPETGPDDDKAMVFDSESNVAVADIDADGKVEILGMKYSYFQPDTGCQPMDTSCCIEGKYAWGRLIALEHDGTFKWESERFHFPDGFIENAAAPAIGDMNGDGLPEIALGNAVFDRNGVLLFEGVTTTQSEAGDGEGGAGHGAFSIFVDLDGDGTNELVAGRTAFDYDGSVIWDAGIPDGLTTAANLDADSDPEIVLFNGGNDFYVLEHTGAIKYGPIHVVSGAVDDEGNEEGFISPNPAVGDVDGDGMAEIVIAATALLYVYEHDTTEKWHAEVYDGTGMSGPTTFDFEGDGFAEVVYADEGSVFVFNGPDGAIKYEAPRSSRTIADNPVIADVDNDGHAEIILSMESPSAIFGMYGLIVYGNSDNNWIGTRRIWNQHSYHITNISESGVVPAYEGSGWLDHNVYRSNVIYCQ